MKVIGYTANKLDYWCNIPVYSNRSLDEWSPLYIRENNENVDADQWERIGWIYPAEVVGTVPPYSIVTGERPSTNSVAAYIERQQDAPADPMNVTRSEFDALAKRLETLEQFASQVDSALELFAKQLANNRELDHIPPADAMTFYDHAFIAAWSAHSFSYSEADAIRHAHNIAAKLTAARRPATGA
jgi:hypothetical protein